MKRSSFFQTSAIVLLSFFIASCAVTPTGPLPAKMTNGMLTDSKSMTLYTFDRDIASSGKSVCNGDCARDWLPFFAPVGAKPTSDFQIITRDDGKAQWAFKGKPLYYWPEDQEPGDKYGDGYRNLWRLIGVNGPVTQTPSASSEGY